ncbi:hypothetical protein N665_0031s0034 [Sinapis alba]|nr:hypothetical protein N665_0031s0034 [Sinapis alba]
MKLSAEAMEAMTRLMTQQINEANQSLATTLSQQLQEKVDAMQQQLEQKLNMGVHEVPSVDSDVSHTPTLLEARRMLKGKGIAGASSKPAPRGQPLRMGGRETISNRRRSPSPIQQEEPRRQQPRAPRQRSRDTVIAGQRVHFHHHSDEVGDHNTSDHSRGTIQREWGREYDPARQQINHLKIKFPAFNGANYPEAYLDWERKMESNFLVQGTYERNKVKIVVSEFNDYALLWWEQLGLTRNRLRELPVTTWEQLVMHMRRKFVPAHYQREILSKLRRLMQGTKTVQDYYQELETLLIRAYLREGDEMVMSRFLGGLNREIKDKVELQSHYDIQDMVHKAELVESQLKRRHNKPSFTPSVVKPKDTKPDTTTVKQVVKTEFKPKSNNSLRNTRCFKCQGMGHYSRDCPNRKVFLLQEGGEIVPQEEEEHETDNEE